MATDMKYYKDLLGGVSGASLGTTPFLIKKGAGRMAAAAGASMARKAASRKLPKDKKKSGGGK